VKKLVVYYLLFFAVPSADAQYFLRGTVRDEKNAPLQSAKIYLHTLAKGTSAGTDGSFGITTNLLYDSITVSLDGYENVTLKAKTDVWQNIILKVSKATIIQNKPRLISFTKDAKRRERFNPFVSDETYFKLIENEFVNAAYFPNTGFSLNVNKASYSNVRRFINMGSRVPPDAVRVEEMVNYFNLGYEKPSGKDIFKINHAIAVCPWDTKNNLLFIKLSAKRMELDKIPPGNFVFLIDVSGSMDMPNRLPLLKEAFQLFVKNLRAVDKISIITYGGMVGTWLAPTAGDQKETINNRLELLEAAGDTPGESAIEAAYKMARATFIPNGNNRVILATDGDFNVGQSSEKALDELVTKQRESGIFLTCLGVGMGNFKDSKLQTLAKRGNGNYAYLDCLHEAEKVLVKELTETLYAVADNAFIDIKFNPASVNKYRLIGFDNKREAVQDQTSNLDGGEIGSGGSTMAIFEIAPNNNIESSNNTLATLQLKYHDVADKTEVLKEMEFSIPNKLTDSTDNAVKFASAVAMFGLKLKESPYVNKATWSNVKTVAVAAVDKNIYLQNDFLKLLDKAILVYEPNKKKKKGKKGLAE
jgi:Ca-activated chloride channel homolog